MKFLDILRQLNMDERIMVGDLHEKEPLESKYHFTQSQIMRVGNIPWDRLRRWEYRHVYALNSQVDKHGKPFLYIAVDDREKGFYDGR